jgi:hypothetical protein
MISITPNRKLVIKAWFIIAVTILLIAHYAVVTLAQGFTRGYATQDSGLQPGMAVTLSPESSADKELVERAGREDQGKVIGITTTIEDSLVTVTSEDHQVYVKSSGVVDAYVSDINGEVMKGDRVTVSPLKGILMKADDAHSAVGVAAENFGEQAAEHQTIASDTGESSVRVAKLAVTLDSSIGQSAGQGGARSQSSLQRLGQSIVGKEVGELQVVIALIIFFIMMIAEGGIIYGAVSSSITSLGRNPLASTIIVRELIRVLGVVIIVMVVGLAAIYAVLLI